MRGCSGDFGLLGWLLSRLPRRVRIVLLHRFGNWRRTPGTFHPTPRAAKPHGPEQPWGIKNADALCSSRLPTKIEYTFGKPAALASSWPRHRVEREPLASTAPVAVTDKLVHRRYAGKCLKPMWTKSVRPQPGTRTALQSLRASEVDVLCRLRGFLADDQCLEESQIVQSNGAKYPHPRDHGNDGPRETGGQAHVREYCADGRAGRRRRCRC